MFHASIRWIRAINQEDNIVLLVVAPPCREWKVQPLAVHVTATCPHDQRGACN